MARISGETKMLNILIFLIVIGVVLYLVNLIPMEGCVKQVINVLAVLFVVLWVLQVLFGMHLGLPRWR